MIGRAEQSEEKENEQKECRFSISIFRDPMVFNVEVVGCWFFPFFVVMVCLRPVIVPTRD